jgi:alkylation response protein AidB-like acyl-CoA dehydrogenase
VAEECDLNETFPRALWKKACDLGFIGVFIDEAYGGPGLGFLEHYIKKKNNETGKGSLRLSLEKSL